MALVAIGGAASVIFVDEPTPTLTIRGPGSPWFVSNQDCEYPSQRRVLLNYDWGGDNPSLALCFMALANGEIPYAIAPPPPEERARQEAEKRARTANGGPPALWPASPWYYTGSSYNPRVEAYVEQSVANLEVTSEARQWLADERWRWRAHKKALGDALPWVFGLIAFLWISTATVGWIVRGFAGVPQGKDFKPTAGA